MQNIEIKINAEEVVSKIQGIVSLAENYQIALNVISEHMQEPYRSELLSKLQINFDT